MEELRTQETCPCGCGCIGQTGIQGIPCWPCAQGRHVGWLEANSAFQHCANQLDAYARKTSEYGKQSAWTGVLSAAQDLKKLGHNVSTNLEYDMALATHQQARAIWQAGVDAASVPSALALYDHR